MFFHYDDHIDNISYSCLVEYINYNKSRIQDLTSHVKIALGVHSCPDNNWVVSLIGLVSSIEWMQGIVCLCDMVTLMYHPIGVIYFSLSSSDMCTRAQFCPAAESNETDWLRYLVLPFLSHITPVSYLWCWGWQSDTAYHLVKCDLTCHQ